MDNNLLKQLIAQHRRVVIPDFGAFLKKETPEGEELVFSPFLRKDDGVVTNAVVNEYGVEAEDARAMIAEFVIYLRQSLASSGRYYIEGVGALTADANGTITLKNDETSEPESVEPEPVPEQKTAPVQPIPQQVQQTPVGFSQAASQPPTISAPGGMTRPQSIQVQGQPQTVRPQNPNPVPPAQHIPQQPYPGRVQQPMPGYPQRPTPAGQQPFPRTQPIPPQPVRRPPVPGQMPQQSGQPRGGQESRLHPGQNQRGGQPPVPPMPRQASPMGGGVPPRGPKDPAQAQRMASATRPVSGPNGRPAQSPRRPVPPRRRPPKTKTDIWLTVAIIAALIVIAIMIYGVLSTSKSDMAQINAAMEPITDTTVLMDETDPGL